VFDVPGFKFGKYHHLEEQGAAEEIDRAAHGYDERMLRQFAERYFPDGCGPTMNLETCLFTNTPDNHFVIDEHPVYPQVTFASPCSGHGFKFASVIGEVMADLSTTGVTRHDISLFRLERLVGDGVYVRHGGQAMSRPVAQDSAQRNGYGRQYQYGRQRDHTNHQNRQAMVQGNHPSHDRPVQGGQLYNGPVWSAARLPEDRFERDEHQSRYPRNSRPSFRHAEDVETFW
jgi:hypothetical protein